jgi:hypothetical protein
MEPNFSKTFILNVDWSKGLGEILSQKDGR